MLISGPLSRFYPYRHWDQPSVAEREPERSVVPESAANKPGQEPSLTRRPVLEAEQVERLSRRRDSRQQALAVEQQAPRARYALDAYHEVSTNQEREYVRAVFGVDVYV